VLRKVLEGPRERTVAPQARPLNLHPRAVASEDRHEIAQRLLAASRAGDALGFIERAEVKDARWIPPEWQDARLAVLEALDRKDEAQAFRWTCFERDLSGEHLRAYLKRLPDHLVGCLF
jgi:hypothetical protein